MAGSGRSTTYPRFAVQSFIGEIALELGKYPKDFLLEIIGPPRKLEVEKQRVTDMLWNYGDPYPIWRHRAPTGVDRF